jgi:hypothetical protein
MFYDISTNTHYVEGGPCKYITVFVKETATMVLFGTLGSNGTFLNSPSASMIFLYSTGGSALCWSDCSRRKCTFLWPSMKPFSMFLASCWLPKMDMMPKVTGTLRQRYTECKAALKVFKRPLPKMSLYGYGMSTTSNVLYSV